MTCRGPAECGETRSDRVRPLLFQNNLWRAAAGKGTSRVWDIRVHPVGDSCHGVPQHADPTHLMAAGGPFHVRLRSRTRLPPPSTSQALRGVPGGNGCTWRSHAASNKVSIRGRIVLLHVVASRSVPTQSCGFLSIGGLSPRKAGSATQLDHAQNLRWTVDLLSIGAPCAGLRAHSGRETPQGGAVFRVS